MTRWIRVRYWTHVRATCSRCWAATPNRAMCWRGRIWHTLARGRRQPPSNPTAIRADQWAQQCIHPNDTGCHYWRCDCGAAGEHTTISAAVIGANDHRRTYHPDTYERAP